jgi:hypothetical protein
MQLLWILKLAMDNLYVRVFGSSMCGAVSGSSHVSYCIAVALTPTRKVACPFKQLPKLFASHADKLD